MEIITGIISGTISALGMGGGTALILILVNFLGIDQHIAQATNLLFFVPTSIVSIIVNYKQKIINFKLGVIIIIFGIVGAIIGANISININSNELRKYFGVFLLLIAIYGIYGMIRQHIKK